MGNQSAECGVWEILTRSRNTHRGTCFPAPVSEKNVLNASSPPPIVLSEGIWPLEGDVMDGKAQVMRGKINLGQRIVAKESQTFNLWRAK
jgi:hypothetical protein|tara:strand:+ start:22 stop:291 length:270 start_codon:yes stop_codon:yes gene_type:complete